MRRARRERPSCALRGLCCARWLIGSLGLHDRVQRFAGGLSLDPHLLGNDLSFGIENVASVRMAAIGVCHLVLVAVDKHMQFEVELFLAQLRTFQALLERGVLRNLDAGPGVD